MHQIPYDRATTVAYARKWALNRNPTYYNFEKIGGDCTNFTSQCLFAGARTMNYTPITGWFYRSSYDRSASWTGLWTRISMRRQDFCILTVSGCGKNRIYCIYI